MGYIVIERNTITPDAEAHQRVHTAGQLVCNLVQMFEFLALQETVVEHFDKPRWLRVLPNDANDLWREDYLDPAPKTSNVPEAGEEQGRRGQ